ncbi:MAG: hypothetical protein COB02_02780 [Candidatus Cloacimonadota bacterium]|nr:MAG: hypothetical protein COB02_02780 [Candidatus Cloacimonadota bacterium]
MKLSLITMILFSLVSHSIFAESAKLKLINGNTLDVESFQFVGETAQAKYFGGDLSIPWVSVKSIYFPQNHIVFLSDGSRVEGKSAHTNKTHFINLQISTGEIVHFTKKDISSIKTVTLYKSEVQARIDAENKSVWAGHLDLGYLLQTGNTEDSKFNFLLHTVRDSKHDTFHIDLSAIQGETNSKENANQAKIATRFDFKTSNSKFFFLMSSLEYDKIKLIDLRSVLGLGLGKTIFNTKKHKLEYSFGLTMDKEVRDNGTKDSTLSALLSMNYLKPVFKESSFSSSINLYPDFKDISGNLKADGRFSLSTPLTEVSDLKITLQEKYQAQVLPGIKKLDTIITTSISYKF